MHGLDTIKAINGWAASKECKALLEKARKKAVKPVSDIDVITKKKNEK